MLSPASTEEHGVALEVAPHRVSQSGRFLADTAPTAAQAMASRDRIARSTTSERPCRRTIHACDLT
jgi:hypothetical protein